MLEQKILKAVLMLRHFNTYETKEKQLEDARRWYTEENEKELDGWIDYLREELAKTPEEREREAEERERIELEAEAEAYYGESPRYSSCTAGDYSPSSPWNAPGMSIHDFI